MFIWHGVTRRVHHPFQAHNGINLFSSLIIVVKGESFQSYIMFYINLEMEVGGTHTKIFKSNLIRMSACQKLYNYMFLERKDHQWAWCKSIFGTNVGLFLTTLISNRRELCWIIFQVSYKHLLMIVVEIVGRGMRYTHLMMII